MSIKNIVPKDLWLQLEKDYEHLKDWHYLVHCETCKQTFYETTLQTVQELIRSGKWNKPQLWYVHTCRHWVANKYHSIRVFAVDPQGHKTLIKDLSAEWTKGSKGFGCTDTAMLNELADLEKRSTSH